MFWNHSKTTEPCMLFSPSHSSQHVLVIFCVWGDRMWFKESQWQQHVITKRRDDGWLRISENDWHLFYSLHRVCTSICQVRKPRDVNHNTAWFFRSMEFNVILESISYTMNFIYLNAFTLTLRHHLSCANSCDHILLLFFYLTKNGKCVGVQASHHSDLTFD